MEETMKYHGGRSEKSVTDEDVGNVSREVTSAGQLCLGKSWLNSLFSHGANAV